MPPTNDSSAPPSSYEMDDLETDTSGVHVRSKSPPPKKGPLNNKDFVIGLVFLLLVVLLWTTSNFVTQVGPCLQHKSQLTCFTSESLRQWICKTISVRVP